jgi:hypothetical protein
MSLHHDIKGILLNFHFSRHNASGLGVSTIFVQGSFLKHSSFDAKKFRRSLFNKTQNDF